MKKFFKSISPIKIEHERGCDIVSSIEGEVIKVESDRVFLKGLIYDFNISILDFESNNKCNK